MQDCRHTSDFSLSMMMRGKVSLCCLLVNYLVVFLKMEAPTRLRGIR